MTESLLARVPVGNLRVPRAEFGALWAEAERLSTSSPARGPDWYAGGVAATCEWLAGAVLRARHGPPRPRTPPATGRGARAYEELIEAEYLAAERLLARRPVRRRCAGPGGARASGRRCGGRGAVRRPPPLGHAGAATG